MLSNEKEKRVKVLSTMVTACTNQSEHTRFSELVENFSTCYRSVKRVLMCFFCFHLLRHVRKHAYQSCHLCRRNWCCNPWNPSCTHGLHLYWEDIFSASPQTISKYRGKQGSSDKTGGRMRVLDPCWGETQGGSKTSHFSVYNHFSSAKNFNGYLIFKLPNIGLIVHRSLWCGLAF